MMLDLKDDPAWDQAETVEGDSDEVGNSDVGEQALDRICRALGQNSTLNVAFSHINTLFEHAAQDWKAAHAGLAILACIVEITKVRCCACSVLDCCFCVFFGLLTNIDLRLFSSDTPQKARAAQDHRAEVMEQVTPFLTHGSSRVRAAALNVLSQLCVQHGPDAQSEVHIRRDP